MEKSLVLESTYTHAHTHTHTTWSTPLPSKVMEKNVKHKLGQSWNQDMEGGIIPVKCLPLHVGPQQTERISGWLGRLRESKALPSGLRV